MPTTRSYERSANNRTYSRRRVPQQIYFPHRRKIVRRPEPNVAEKKQMTFVPEMMRRQETVQDSEEEALDSEEEDTEDGGVVTEEPPVDPAKGAKKRSRDATQESSDDEQSVPPAPKRVKRVTAPKKRKLVAPIKHESDGERPVTPPTAEQVADTRRTQRQSTMTQIVDGRRPTPGTKSPRFQRVKNLRIGRARKGKIGADERSKSQRTLTQMVSGLTPLETVSDEDLEEDTEDITFEGKDDRDFNAVFARGLAEDGLFCPDHGVGMLNAAAEGKAPMKRRSTERRGRIRDLDLDKEASSAERTEPHAPEGPDLDSESEDEYQPTQHIVDTTPSRKTWSSPRASHQSHQSPTPEQPAKASTSKTFRSRFALLSTPEKRRVLVIPSSQSPCDSPVSIEVTPNQRGRSVLKMRSGNVPNAAETPSKRRKQVTFEGPDKEQIPPPPPLRKFPSVIQDSEDEGEAMSDDGGSGEGAQGIGPETRLLAHRVDSTLPGVDIGSETQAILFSIDRACENADEDAAWVNRALSEELGNSIHPGAEESQELGDRQKTLSTTTEVNANEEDSVQSRYTVAGIKQEPVDMVDYDLIPPSYQLRTSEPTESLKKRHASTVPLSFDRLPSQASQQEQQQQIEIQSPKPIEVIGDSDEDQDELICTPPDTVTSHRTLSSKEHAVQVPRSPNSHEETQRSFSSKAEQQLQSEYDTFSQHRPNPPTSSMHVVPDPGFSYQATPFAPRPPTQQTQHSGHLSQATTVDPTQLSPRTTPRKARSKPTRSTTTTPSKIPSSMPFVSPAKPPPLLIPSSYPSPGKVMAGWSSPAAGGSSPVAGRAQNGRDESQWRGDASWEDFSIPAPPPPLDISDDEEM